MEGEADGGINIKETIRSFFVALDSGELRKIAQARDDLVELWRAGSQAAGLFAYQADVQLGDDQGAIVKLQQLAGENYAPALYELGVHYQYGRAVKKDKARAIELFAEAAIIGHLPALKKLVIERLRGSPKWWARIVLPFKLLPLGLRIIPMVVDNPLDSRWLNFDDLQNIASLFDVNVARDRA